MSIAQLNARVASYRESIAEALRLLRGMEKGEALMDVWDVLDDAERRAERAAAMAGHQTEADVVRGAVSYLIHRIQTDPDVGYYLGWGTEAFRRLCLAQAALTGRLLDEVERDARRNLIPAHREQRPQVAILRERLEELER